MQDKSTLITGIVPGYPTSELSLEIAETLRNAGADILELSASFSEPIADGRTLQLAHQRVLASGFTKAQGFLLYKKIKDATQTPLFLIEYANVIYQIGFDAYYKKAAENGINYILVPDVPLEESEPFATCAQKYGIAHIFMVAPTTNNKRVNKICVQAQKYIPKQTSASLPFSSFLYLVSVTGVTGTRKDIENNTLTFIKRVRVLTDLPIIVGFGISKYNHVNEIMQAGGSGVVTCSPIVDIVHNLSSDPPKMFKAIEGFVKQLQNL